jgi:hypothetical protein
MCLASSACILGLASNKDREVKMELTLRQYGIKVKVLRERAEEKTPDIIKRIYRRRYSGEHRDPQEEYLKASGSRYISPIR